MKIHIIRHGDPDYAKDTLTEKGWREAELLANRLVKMNIDDFYASPMGRAQDTAKPTIDRLKKPMRVYPWLHEFGGAIHSPYTGGWRVCWDLPVTDWANDEQSYDKDKSLQKDIFENVFNEGDKPANVCYQEVKQGVDELLALYGYKKDNMVYRAERECEKEIALFCHCAVGSVILGYLIGISPMLAMHNLFLTPTSVTTLVTETDKWGATHFRCIAMSDTSHLYAGEEPLSTVGLFQDFCK